MTCRELFETVEQKVGEQSPLFGFFLENYSEAMDGTPDNPSDWREVPLEAGMIPSLYQGMCGVLSDLAWRLADNVRDHVYTEATAIGDALRETLQAQFQVEIRPCIFESPVTAMIREGFLNVVKTSDGKELVMPNPEKEAEVRQILGKSEPPNN